MAGTTEILDLNGLNAAGYGRIGVYINLGFEPYPENYNPYRIPHSTATPRMPVSP